MRPLLHCLLAAQLWCSVSFAVSQTFIPASTSALVKVGGEVEVRLGVTELRGGEPVGSGRELDFVVVGGARAGQIVELRQLPRAGAKDAAILRYRHLGGRDVFRDVIRYIVVEKQSGTEVTSGTILIQVAVSRLEIAGNSIVDFGNVAVGSTAEADVVLRNSGTEVASGRVLIEKPFLIGDDEKYFVPSGGTARLKLGFSPTSVGEASRVMRFSDNPELEVKLQGVGVGALTVSASELHWLLVEGKQKDLPEKSFDLRMASGAGAQVEIQVGDFLKVEPQNFFLGTGPARRVRVTGKMPAAGSYSGELVIRAGFEQSRLPWCVEVWPDAALKPAVQSLVFQTRVESEAVKEVEFCNEGGLPWVGSFVAEPPFVVVAAPLVILPGQSAVVRLALRAKQPGRVSGNLTWGGKQGLSVVLSGNVTTRPDMTPVAEILQSPERENSSASNRVGRVALLPKGGGFLLEGEEIHVIPPERFFPKIHWRQLSPTEVILEWEAGNVVDLPPLEIRMLHLLQDKNYIISQCWMPLEDVIVHRDDDGKFFARIDRLYPGAGFSFSVWSKSGISKDSVPMSEKVVVFTRGIASDEGSDAWLWFAFGGICATAFLWFHFLRKKQSSNRRIFL